MKKTVRVFAPATISNVGPGFDLMGFAIEQPGDILRIETNESGTIGIVNETDCCLPDDPEKNVASVAVRALLDDLHIDRGFDLIFEKKINPGSGIGSSAASCAAAVFGVNELLGRPLSVNELIPHALKGEFIASGSIHADNIAPALLGGFVLIRDYDPIDVIRLTAPDSLYCTVVHPDIEIRTSDSRRLIPPEMPLRKTLRQCGNIAGLVAGITTSDYGLIGRSLEDVIAEPVRAILIPGYLELKQKLIAEGALGANISGSGPSVFAFSRDRATAVKLAAIMAKAFNDLNFENMTYVSLISPQGTRLLGEQFLTCNPNVHEILQHKRQVADR